MTITTSIGTLTVTENKKSWTLRRKKAIVSVVYNVSKELCPTFDALEKYAVENNL